MGQMPNERGLPAAKLQHPLSLVRIAYGLE
jgi:hypothetical protein